MKPENKTELRKRILNLLKTQKEEDRLKKSRVILRKLFLRPEFRQAKTVLFYASFDGEVDTFEMMKRARKLGKTIGLPVILKDQKRLLPALAPEIDDSLEHGPYGIQQPRMDNLQSLTLEEIDLVVVPGVAFDKKNNRLGRGQGYYDRFLSELPHQTPSIGLCFDFQIFDCLPLIQAHDKPVQRVITN